MPSEFCKALLSSVPAGTIPAQDDLFAPMIGEWDFEYVDGHGTQEERHVAGEWIFTRILEGAAVQDIFICPSRVERRRNPQPDAEYGTTLRFYNEESGAWDVFYGCAGGVIRLEARRAEDTVVLTEITGSGMQWIFSGITPDSFHWRNITTRDDGSQSLNCELLARRRK